MKNRIWLVVFFFVTFLLILPPKDTRDDGYHSSELTVHTIETTTRSIAVYTDAEGKILKPANGGYSVVVREKDANGRNVLERYYQARRVKTFEELAAVEPAVIEQVLKPEEQWGKQYGLRRVYNEAGECTEYTYLDKYGKSMDITSGYSTVVQEYDEYHRRVKETYYSAAGEQVLYGAKVWGQAFTYYTSDEAAMGMPEPEEEKLSWLIETVTYLNQEGEPMVASSGYAMVRRFYDENKRTKRELFYDSNGQQVVNAMGAYGQDYSYDELGRQITCTYLNQDCQPTLCYKGYSKVVRTHFKNNAVRTEMYFTADGTPAKLSHGESGVYAKITAQQYLNADGKVMLVLDNFLRGNPLLVIAFALIIWVVSARLNKNWNRALLVAYVCFILYMTLLTREAASEATKLDFWKTVSDLLTNYYVRVQAIENVYLFIPFGVIWYHGMRNKKGIFLGILFSILIEVTQYVGHLGSAEVMDVLTNGLGTVVGVGMGKIIRNKNDYVSIEATGKTHVI